MATEDTPQETIVNYRWDGRAEDRATYDLIFDVAIRGNRIDGDPIHGLLLTILNEWEKNPRFVTMPVISAAYDVAKYYQEAMDLIDSADLDQLWDELRCGDTA